MNDTASFIRKRWPVLVLVAVLASAATLAGVAAERYTSTTAFCVGCHSMTWPYEEVRSGPHYGNLGVNPECGDCHLPPEPVARMKAHVVSGVRDIISEMRGVISTREDFLEKRAELAERARENLRAWDSSPCRSCHTDPRPRSEMGRAMHERIKGSKGGEATCVDCHRRVGHRPLRKP